MQHASNDLIDALSKAGYRITAARKKIVAALLASTGPITIQQLAQTVAADEASVYRTVSVLLDEGLLEEIRSQGQRPRYAPVHHHHHHVICRGCGVIAHVACEKPLPPPRHVPGFARVEEHEVTFYGFCQKCG